jgi:hypothetical protein
MTVDAAPCYDDRMNVSGKRTSKATAAAAKARTLRRLRRMAQELRDAGWIVEEPKPGVR